MKNLSILKLTAILALASSVSAFAKAKPQKVAMPETGFPIQFTKAVKGAERFEGADYFNMMASDGIRKVDAKALYIRLQAAVEANERYKALYLARILTALKPNSAAAWSNRAKLAAVLGLNDEAAGCEQNAKSPSALVNVSIADVLPGSALMTKPTTLSDWAAATALLSDGIAVKEGQQALVAFKDSVSGIHEATKEEVAEHDSSNRESGLNAAGPWADPEPIQLRHVLANAFDLRGGEPMQFTSVSKGSMFGAMLMAGLSGWEQNINPMAASQASNLAMETAGRASQVPSHYKGGSFTRVVFDDGREAATADRPKSSGEFATVGEPLPFLWASGGSTEPYFSGEWMSTQGTKVKKVMASDQDDVNDRHAKLYRPPADLRFPKLMSLCTQTNADGSSCSNPLSLLELLLTRDDVAALAPGLVGRIVDLDSFRRHYDSSVLLFEVGNGGGNQMWGIDSDGAMYRLAPDPTSWLIPIH